MTSTDIEFRIPRPEDGINVHGLVALCPPLDPNSVYCNLLQCTHFAGTSVAAEMNGELVGFVSGYCPPERPDTLFVWQVAVGEQARGRGLATRMIKSILQRPQNSHCHYIETSITGDNQASWALFEGLADKLGTSLEKSVMFDENRHFAGRHSTEYLARIGPF